MKQKQNPLKEISSGQEVIKLDLDKASYEEIVKSINAIQLKAQQDWFFLYELFDAIERRELYLPEFTSFTAWLNNYCADKQHGLSVDRAFTIKRAGKILKDFLNRKEMDYTAVNYIPPQTLVNIDKTARCEKGISQEKEADRQKRRDELIEQADRGELTRNESVRLYKKARYQKKVEKQWQERNSGASPKELKDFKRDTRIADELKAAVCSQWQWLGEKQERWGKSNFQRKKDNRIRDYYRGIQEFAFSVSGEEHGRKQADVVIFENLTSFNPVEATVHAIEIKVDIDDFRRDVKYVDYLNYVDYLWLLAPEDLLAELDPSEIPERVGILAYKEKDQNTGLKLDENLELIEITNKQKKALREGSVYQVRKALENKEADIEGTLRRFAVHLH